MRNCVRGITIRNKITQIRRTSEADRSVAICKIYQSGKMTETSEILGCFAHNRFCFIFIAHFIWPKKIRRKWKLLKILEQTKTNKMKRNICFVLEIQIYFITDNYNLAAWRRLVLRRRVPEIKRTQHKNIQTRCGHCWYNCYQMRLSSRATLGRLRQIVTWIRLIVSWI